MVHGSITLDKIFVDSTKGFVKIVDLFGVSQVGTPGGKEEAPQHDKLQVDLNWLADFARQLA